MFHDASGIVATKRSRPRSALAWAPLKRPAQPREAVAPLDALRRFRAAAEPGSSRRERSCGRTSLHQGFSLVFGGVYFRLRTCSAKSPPVVVDTSERLPLHCANRPAGIFPMSRYYCSSPAEESGQLRCPMACSENWQQRMCELEAKNAGLLDEVEIISSVFRRKLHGGLLLPLPRSDFRRFRESFPQARNINVALIGCLANPTNWCALESPFYGRSDLAAEFAHNRSLFGHSRFKDLTAAGGRRPFLIINALDRIWQMENSSLSVRTGLICCRRI